MDLDQVIAELRDELDKVKHAVQALESLQRIREKRQESEDAALQQDEATPRPGRRKKPVPDEVAG